MAPDPLITLGTRPEPWVISRREHRLTQGYIRDWVAIVDHRGRSPPTIETSVFLADSKILKTESRAAAPLPPSLAPVSPSGTAASPPRAVQSRRSDFLRSGTLPEEDRSLRTAEVSISSKFAQGWRALRYPFGISPRGCPHRDLGFLERRSRISQESEIQSLVQRISDLLHRYCLRE